MSSGFSYYLVDRKRHKYVGNYSKGIHGEFTPSAMLYRSQSFNANTEEHFVPVDKKEIPYELKLNIPDDDPYFKNYVYAYYLDIETLNMFKDRLIRGYMLKESIRAMELSETTDYNNYFYDDFISCVEYAELPKKEQKNYLYYVWDNEISQQYISWFLKKTIDEIYDDSLLMSDIKYEDLVIMVINT